MTRRYWVVGASSGIGYHLAEQLLERGERVAVSARTMTSLNALKQRFGASLLLLPLDVGVQEDIAIACRQIESHWQGLDVVVYNAGICEYVDNGGLSYASCARVFDTNVLGLVRVCELVKPLLQRGVRAQVVAVSSSAAFVPLPRAEFYGASKAAVSYFMNSLRLAWSALGITVQLVHPGFVKTPLTDKNDFAMPFLLSADDAARRMIRGIDKRVSDIHFPKRLTLVLKFMGLLPLSMQQFITGRLIKS